MHIEMIDNSFRLEYAVHYQLPDELVDRSMQFHFRHSNHSFTRAAQRGLDNKKISAVLEFGESYCKQGLTYYVLGEHNIPEHLKKSLEKIKNSVVVVNSNSCLLTCYRTARGHKRIKAKNKTLGIYDC